MYKKQFFLVTLMMSLVLFFTPFGNIVLADDDEEFTPLGDVAKDVAGDPEKITNDTVGNQWSQLGSTSRFLVQFTQSSETVAYEDLEDKAKLSHAAKYGFVLDRTGLDHSFTNGDSDSIFTWLGRLAIGSLVLAGYMIHTWVTKIFGLSMDFLQQLNVFTWLSDTPVNQDSPFAPIHSVFRDIYQVASSLGILMSLLALGVGIGLAIMGIRISNSNRHTTMGKGVLTSVFNYLLRLFVILASPFLLGGLFGAVVEQASNAYTTTSSSNYAIYSNLVDFEKWAKHSRLGLPTNVADGELVSTRSDGKIPAITHHDILRINTHGAGLENARLVLNSTDSGNPFGDLVALDDAETGLSDSAASVIMRWMKLTKFTASDYEAYVRKQARTSGIDDDTYKEAVISDGGLQTNGSANATYFMSNGYALNSTSASLGSSANAGLSSLGMYNYLSTVFGQTAMTFVQSDSLLGQMSTPYHASVGLAGRGFVAFGNGMMMLSLVYSLALLGFMFSYFVMHALITSIPKILGNLAATAFGSMVYFVKLIVSVVVIVLEVFGGALLYAIAQRIVVGIASMGDAAFDGVAVFGSSMFSTHISQASVSATMYGAMNVFAAIFLLWVSLVMIKSRGKVLAIFGDLVEGSLNKILGMIEATGEAGQARVRDNMLSVDKDGNNVGSLTDGQFLRNAQTGAKSGFGKASNHRNDIADAIKAKEGALGRPLTTAERLKEGLAQTGRALGEKGLKGAGDVLAAQGMKNIADDLRDKRKASIADGLRDGKAAQAENERAFDDGLDVHGGAPKELTEVDNLRSAFNSGGTDGSVDGDAMMLGGNSTPPLQPLGGGSVGVDGSFTDENGQVFAAGSFPAYASKDEADADVAEKQQHVDDAKRALALAKTPVERQKAQQALQRAERALQSAQIGQRVQDVQSGATGFVQPQLDADGTYTDANGTRHAVGAYTTYNSQDDGIRGVLTAESKLDDAKQALANAQTPKEMQQAKRDVQRAEQALQAAKLGRDVASLKASQDAGQMAQPFTNANEAQTAVATARQARNQAVQDYVQGQKDLKEGKIDAGYANVLQQQAVKAEQALQTAEQRYASTMVQDATAAVVGTSQMLQDGSLQDAQGVVHAPSSFASYGSLRQAAMGVMTAQSNVEKAKQALATASTPQETQNAQQALQKAQQEYQSATLGREATRLAQGASTEVQAYESPQVAQQALQKAEAQRHTAMTAYSQAIANGASGQALQKAKAQYVHADIEHANVKNGYDATIAPDVFTPKAVQPKVVTPTLEQEQARAFDVATGTVQPVASQVTPYSSIDVATGAVQRAEMAQEQARAQMAVATTADEKKEASSALYTASTTLAQEQARQQATIAQTASTALQNGEVVPSISPSAALAYVSNAHQNVENARSQYATAVLGQREGRVSQAQVKQAEQQYTQALQARTKAQVTESMVRQAVASPTVSTVHNGDEFIPVHDTTARVASQETAQQVASAVVTSQARLSLAKNMLDTLPSDVPKERVEAVTTTYQQAKATHLKALETLNGHVAHTATERETRHPNAPLPTFEQAQQDVQTMKAQAERATQVYTTAKAASLNGKVPKDEVNSMYTKAVQAQGAYAMAQQTMTIVARKAQEEAAAIVTPQPTVVTPQPTATPSPQQEPVTPKPVVPSVVIPTYTSKQEAVSSVRQLRQEMEQVSALLHYESDKAERAILQDKRDDINKRLKVAQVGASNFYLAQPTTMIKNRKSVYTNRQAHEFLTDLQRQYAQLHVNRTLAQGTPAQKRQYRMQLKSLNKTIDTLADLGIDRDHIETASGVKNALRIINTEHATYVKGVQ